MCSCIWVVSRVTEMCMKMCSEPSVWLSAHQTLTFTCTWCVHVNVQWSDCLMCSCNCAVSPMADVHMKMCTEPFVWLSAHLNAHVRHTGHCTFTCSWCVHVNVQWSDSLMYSCNLANWPMCAWKFAMSQLSYSLQIYMHTSNTRVTAHLHALDVCMQTFSDSTVWCVHVNGQWAQWLMCAWKCVLSHLSHLPAHVRHTCHGTFDACM